MRVRIDVTERDIKRGDRKSNDTCPIARACDRVFAVPVFVYAWLEVAREHPIELPLRAVEFISAFDNGKPVKPFRFTVNAPAAVVRKRLVKKAAK